MIFIKKCMFVLMTTCLAFLPWSSMISNPSHTERLRVLKKKGFQPQVVYDIGAHQGEWTVEIQRIFNDAQFFLFEANEYNKPYLQRSGFPFFIELLGDRQELVPFYIINNTGDSVFREQTNHYKDGSCSENLVQMTTLDAVVQKNGLPWPNLVKMDVQGAEKLIIQGGSSIICNAEVVILEAGILEYNKDAPLIFEMMELMYKLGYCVLDMLELHYLPTQELFEVDILFVKKDSLLIRRGILC